MIGKTLAHYEITGLLGKGGMGEVFRALDAKLGREVAGAVKILDFGLARAFADDPNESSDMLNSPTITAAMTRVGVILGTAPT